MLAPGLNGSSLGGELPLDPFFFFFWFLGVVGEEEEQLEGEWEGFTACCCFVSSLNLLSFLWCPSYWAHWTFSFASCLVGLHTFECCDLYCLGELSEYLKMETGLRSAVLAVDVVECHHHSIHCHCSSW